MAFEIVEFEKLIESQYITKYPGRADELVIQAKELNYQNTISSKIIKPVTATLWHYAKTGYVNDEEQQYIDDYFHKHTKFDEDKFGFRENIGFITLIYGKVFDSRFFRKL
jgi:hypothetical protein